MSPSREPCRHGLRGVLAILLAFVLTMTIVQGWLALRDRPNQTQRIAAILVSWGLEPDGFDLPVPADEIDRRVAMLRSADGEERVRAAHWLAAHGVRDAGAAIASAMHDPGTLRPCQLAHALGHLGDERWTDELVWAAKQPWNGDLQVCATIGLEALASEPAVDALIDLAENGAARTSAIETLGVIGDARAIPDLQRIAAASEDRHVREAALRAVDRIRLLTAAEPVPALVDRFAVSVQSGDIDGWALRCLARLGDGRAVATLERAIKDQSLSSRQREFVAACLVACGEEGRMALSGCCNSDLTVVRLVAQSALAVVEPAGQPWGRGHAAFGDLQPPGDLFDLEVLLHDQPRDLQLARRQLQRPAEREPLALGDQLSVVPRLHEQARSPRTPLSSFHLPPTRALTLQYARQPRN